MNHELYIMLAQLTELAKRNNQILEIMVQKLNEEVKAKKPDKKEVKE